MKTNSQLRAHWRWWYGQKNTPWLWRRRQTLLVRLMACEGVLRDRGHGILPLPMLEALKVMSK